MSNFTPSEKEVMLHIRDNGDNVPYNIAEDVERHNKTVQRKCRELTEQGILRNKGQGVYTLTEKGEEVVEKLMDLDNAMKA